MKKLLAILLAAAMVLSFAACTKTEETGSKDNSTGSFKVDIFWYTFNDPFLSSVRNGMLNALNEIPDINYKMHDCENKQDVQTKKVETAITQGTSLLIVNIVTTQSEEAAQNICDMAKEAGVPIIFFNREVSDKVVSSYDNCVFVGTNADEAGYLQGELIANFFKKADNAKYDLNKDGKISYIMFRGEHGNPEAFGRTKYSVEKANELLTGTYQLTPSPANEKGTQYDDDGISNFYLYSNWDSATATQLMSTALTSYSLTNGDIEIIIANNDASALGAIEALNEANFNTGAAGAGYIPVFGVDATADAVEAMNAGKMTGSILQDPIAMANCVALLAQNVKEGKALLDGTSGYSFDAGVSKIRIAYQIVE